MHLVGKLLFPLCLFLLVALPINRLCSSTHTRQTIYNQAYGYQTFKQNLQAHTNTQINQASIVPTESYTLIRKFKFNEGTPRGVPGPVFKKTPEMPRFTKMTPLRLHAGMRSLCTHKEEEEDDTVDFDIKIDPSGRLTKRILPFCCYGDYTDIIWDLFWIKHVTLGFSLHQVILNYATTCMNYYHLFHFCDW